jgi:hypothetical protein
MSGRDRKIKTSIKYTSSNGFTGILYGESSMSIGKVQADGTFHEYLHTGSRNGNGIEYLKEMVDGFPRFMEALEELRTGLDQEEEGDDE